MPVRLLLLTKVMVGSLNDWQKERQYRFLNDKKEERGVKVIRCGDERVIDVKDLLVGDIALLEPGEIIPCDGVFISGHNVRCDESGATGESDAIKNFSYDDCIALRESAKYAIHDARGFDAAHIIQPRCMVKNLVVCPTESISVSRFLFGAPNYLPRSSRDLCQVEDRVVYSTSNTKHDIYLLCRRRLGTELCIPVIKNMTTFI
jgi:magnesium-transporting ATPase (P-type)